MKRWLWMLPLLLAAAVYAPAPWGDLVWDDYFIEQQLPSFQSLGDLLFPPDGIRGWTYAYYRPVVVLSYMLDAALFGSGSTVGPHLSNLIFHIVTTWLVWLLAVRLFAQRPNASIAAVIAAAVFAVHPIHTESVHWIAGRSDLLATMFVLVSILFALRWRDGGAIWAVSLAGLAYLLALLSKEIAVAALLIVPAVLLLTPQGVATQPAEKHGQLWWVFSLVFVSVTALYFVLRDNAVDSGGDGLLGLSISQSIWSLAQAGAYYLTKVAVPWPQSNIVTWEMLPGRLVSTLILLFGAAVAAVGIMRWRRQRGGLLLLVMIWFALGIAPSLVIAIGDVNAGGVTAPAGKFPVAERYLYLPSVAFALFLGRVFVETLASRWRSQSLIAAVAIIVIYSAASLDRGFIWQSNLRLWTDTTSKVRTHGAPWNELGRSYRAINDDENALSAFLRALELKNTAADKAAMSHNIGTIFLRRDDLENAEKYYQQALDEKPDLAESHYGMGMTYASHIGRILKDGGSRESFKIYADRATHHFRTAVRINPDFHLARLLSAQILTDYGWVQESAGDRLSAVASYQAARDQVDDLLGRIPEYDREKFAQLWQSQINVNVLELGARIDAGLQRLP